MARIYVGEIELPPGWSGSLVHVWTGVSSVSSVDSNAYLGKQDVTSAILSSSDSSSGNAQTSKVLTIPSDGTYEGKVVTLEWIATYQGKTDRRWLKITVPTKEVR